MPSGKSSLTKLTQCLEACNGDEVCMKACEDTFVAEGGKVFSTPEGGKVFSVEEGGKVFSVEEGGKVF
jgi:hypothetical protein